MVTGVEWAWGCVLVSLVCRPIGLWLRPACSHARDPEKWLRLSRHFLQCGKILNCNHNHFYSVMWSHSCCWVVTTVHCWVLPSAGGGPGCSSPPSKLGWLAWSRTGPVLATTVAVSSWVLQLLHRSFSLRIIRDSLSFSRPLCQPLLERGAHFQPWFPATRVSWARTRDAFVQHKPECLLILKARSLTKHRKLWVSRVLSMNYIEL